MPYSKSWFPLESTPEVFNGLKADLGASSGLAFFDVFSLDQDAIQFLPRPAFALILAYPDASTTGTGQSVKKKVTSGTEDGDEDMVWLKQTIDNACGLFAVLNALCNLPEFIEPESFVSKLLDIKPAERTTYIVESEELERIYSLALQRSFTDSPSLDEEVEHHYVCFVKSPKGDSLYVLDGELHGPERKCTLGKDEDVLSEPAVEVIRRYLSVQEDGTFALLGLSEREK